MLNIENDDGEDAADGGNVEKVDVEDLMSKQELEEALQQTKTVKSFGYDNNRTFQRPRVSERGNSNFNILNLCLKRGNSRHDKLNLEDGAILEHRGKTARVVACEGKGETASRSDHREISLTSHAAKLCKLWRREHDG